MTHVTTHLHGAFSWADLATSDPAGAKRFYGELFALTYVDETMGPEGTYTRLQQGGRDVVGLYRLLPEQQAQGRPAQWMPYVTVDDVDAVAARAEGLGGRLLLPPLDAHDAGRMAVVVDPSGGHLGLWKAKRKCGAELMHAPGTLTWTELLSRDCAAAVTFLTGLLGWKAQPQDMGQHMYTVFVARHGGVAGAMQIPEAWGPAPTHWLVYFAVDDCDQAADRVRRHGGQVRTGPQDIPGVGRFAVCVDPQGASFGILRDTK